MKKIGFLSFGHWANHPSYKTRTAADTLLQSIDLAVAAEEIGVTDTYSCAKFEFAISKSTIIKNS